MKNTIIYFTGTGNSLALARLFAEKLPDSKIVAITEMLKQVKPRIDTDSCGFVFPVYCQDIPEIVKRLVRRLEFKNDIYFFAIATHNGNPGYSNFTIDKLLRKKRQKLSAGFTVLMPGNCINPYIMNSEAEVKHRLSETDSFVDKILKIITNRQSLAIEGNSSIRMKLKSLRSKLRFKYKYKIPESFWVSEACNLCGICARICPEKNITISSGSVSWNNHCQMCFACIHWCPQQAVQNGPDSLNRKRYHHPDITVNDMMIRD